MINGPRMWPKPTITRPARALRCRTVIHCLAAAVSSFGGSGGGHGGGESSMGKSLAANGAEIKRTPRCGILKIRWNRPAASDMGMRL